MNEYLINTPMRARVIDDWIICRTQDMGIVAYAWHNVGSGYNHPATIQCVEPGIVELRCPVTGIAVRVPGIERPE